MSRILDYESAIGHAQELLSEQIRDPQGEANPEYARGIVEFICEATGVGMEFKDTIARRLGVVIDTFKDVPADHPTLNTDTDNIIMGLPR